MWSLMSQVQFHHNREYCIKLSFLFLNHQSALTPTYALHREGSCVLLLPGDSLGFDFWKAWADQSAVCCGSSPPISCEFVPRVSGLLLCFCNTYPPQCLSSGRVWSLPVCQHACVHAWMCVFTYTVDAQTYTHDSPLYVFSLGSVYLLCSNLKTHNNKSVTCTQWWSKSYKLYMQPIILCHFHTLFLVFLSCTHKLT